MKKFSDLKTIDSWKSNVHAWVSAVRANEIKSRALVTNKAIIDVVLAQAPKTVLDVGCGEGWLVRELNKVGIVTLGIDAVPQLIDYAQKEGNGRYRALTYEALSHSEINEQFDVIVCNFSLLGYESVNNVFQTAPALLNEGGSLIVQTINPLTEGRDKYKDGWREGSWAGFSNEFNDPAPWYFRCLVTWKTLFSKNGFALNMILEPSSPMIETPTSIIFVGVKTSKNV